jgi:hypothetical protein
LLTGVARCAAGAAGLATYLGSTNNPTVKGALISIATGEVTGAIESYVKAADEPYEGW